MRLSKSLMCFFCVFARGLALRPSWAWDTVGSMTFTHTCNMSGPWSDAALDTLAKFPLVTIERFMGQYSHCPWSQQTARPANCTVEEAPVGLTDAATGLYVEDHAIAALRQLKRRNPKLAAIFYHDSGRMWTNDQPDSMGRVPKMPRKYWNPTVYRADNYLVSHRPEWLLKNVSEGFVYDHYANNHIYDHGKPGVPEWWGSVCLNVTATGVADGCFADYASMGGVDPAAPGQPPSTGVSGVMRSWNVSKATAVAWVNGHQRALDLLTEALQKSVDGILIANGGANKHTNAFMMETFMPSSGDIRTIQSAVNKGLVNQVHCNYYAQERNPDVRDCLAAFLIGTGPGAFFSGPFGWQIRQQDADPLGLHDVRQRWLPEFDHPLGEPTTNGTLGSDNVWRRSFRSARVTFNATVCKGRVDWSDGSVTEGPGCTVGCTKCFKQIYPPL